MNKNQRFGSSGPNQRAMETRGYRPKPVANRPASPQPPNQGSAIKTLNNEVKQQGR